jgi:hypothetical protein
VLLVNGDFESGNVGFATQYTYSHGDIWAEGKYDITHNPCDSHPWCTCFVDHTTGSGLMMAVNGATVADRVVWSEVVPVSHNTAYTFTLWLANWSIQGDFNLPVLDILINDSVAATFSAPPIAGVWQSHEAVWESGSASSATVTIIDRTLGYGGDDFALDDIAFAPTTPVAVEATTWSRMKAIYR